MANPSRTVRVRFDGDTKGLTKAVSDGVKDIKKFSDGVRKNSRSGGVIGGIVDSIKSGAGSVKESLSSVFQGGLKGALSSPVIAPLVIGALASVAAIAAPAIATLMGGALVAGLGAGFVGFGFKLLLENKKIKKQFEDDWATVKKTLTDAFKPLIPVLDTVRGVMKSVAREFAPFIKQSSQLAQGPLKDFVRDLGKGLKELTPTLKPLMVAFSNILRDIGPQLPGLMKELSDSLTSLFGTVGQNSSLFAAMFVGLVKGVTLGIDALNWLIKVFRSVVNVTSDIAGAFLDWADTTLGAIQSVVDAVAKIPGPMQSTFQNVSRSISDARKTVQGWSKDVKAVPKVLKLKGDIADLNTKLASARGQLKDPNLTKTRRAILKAEISELLRKKNQAQASINSLRGKTVSLFVKTEFQSDLSRAALRSAAGRATGGPVTSGRSYLVGERGPELLHMGQGQAGNVTPNHALGNGNVEVKVFIGDQELKGMVRTEVNESNRGIRRRALAA